MTHYVTLEEALEAHEELIERYGGSHGIRDAGLLEAALFRPRTGYYADLIEEAAALWESMAQNHPFIDGNKRAAFMVTHLFLNLNGFDLRPEADEVQDFVLGLYKADAFDFEHVAAWLRENVVPMES